MNRRSFLTRREVATLPTNDVSKPSIHQSSKPLNITAGLDEFTTPLTVRTAGHLLRRLTFQPTVEEINFAIGKTSREVLSSAFQPMAVVPPNWVNVAPNAGDPQDTIIRRIYELQSWWVKQMLTLKGNVQEKMTFFWHNHFTSGWRTVYNGQYLFKQNNNFRNNFSGDFRKLTKSMVSDPAMLIYLDGYVSSKTKPNENFGREVLELFCLGVGNYTEEDIVEVTKCCTGWRIAGLSSTLMPNLFDGDIKTIFKGTPFEKTGAFNSDEMVDAVFDHPACARWIASKLWKFFIYEVPDPVLLGTFADMIKANNFNLTEPLKTLLSSQYFFDEQVHGALIKSPIDHNVGLSRQLYISEVPADYMVSSMTDQNLEILSPPSVEGWKGYHLWINSSTLPIRQRFAENLIEGRKANANPLGIVPNIKELVINHHFNGVDLDDADQLVSFLTDYLIPMTISQEQHNYLLDELLQGAPKYEWKIALPAAEARLKFLLKAIVNLPEFQLT